ncbi:MAG: radical SAM protein [Elusimicrobiales bacterium]|nr:radical SAM protein [Elusimicrobiales bacterium]
MNLKRLDILLAGDEEFLEDLPDRTETTFSGKVLDLLRKVTRVVDIVSPRLGIVLLATHAARAGYSVAVVNNVLSSPLSRLRFALLLRLRRPRAVGISTVAMRKTETTAQIVAIARRLCPGAAVILGGQNAVQTPATRKLADLTVTGHGENVLPRLLGDLKAGRPLDALDGLHKDENGSRILKGDPYYGPDGGTHLPDWKYTTSSNKVIPVEGSRGCWHTCAFCTTSNQGRQVFRKPADVLSEALNDVRKYGAKQIHFVDSSFTCNKEFTDEFLRLLGESGEKFRWSCFSRVDDFTTQPGLPGRMVRAGCVLSYLGIESVHDDILERMRKGYVRRTIADGLSNLEGLNVYGNFIVGFPGDTEEKVRDTVAFIERFQFDKVSIAPLYVPPQLYAQARAKPELFCHLRGKSEFEWEHDTMNRARAVELADWARKTLNKHKGRTFAY